MKLKMKINKNRIYIILSFLYVDKTLFLKFFGNVKKTPNFLLKYHKFMQLKS